MSSKVSGMLEEQLDPVLQREMIAPGLARGFPVVLPLITRINKAHVLMLEARGILPKPMAQTLARGILDLEQRPAADFDLDSSREDAYFNYEAALIAHIGSEIGGRVHVARSRNDLNATIDRLRARATLIDILRRLAELRGALIAQAGRYSGVLMPGYTHMQPAQPLTFGYYLAGLAHALERDYQRLAQVWPRINICPLGAVVRSAMNIGRPANEIDAAMIADQSERSLGRRIILSPELVAMAVDPAKVAEARRNTGGPSTADMHSMLAGLRTRRDRDAKDIEAIELKLDEADRRLQSAFAACAA